MQKHNLFLCIFVNFFLNNIIKNYFFLIKKKNKIKTKNLTLKKKNYYIE